MIHPHPISISKVVRLPMRECLTISTIHIMEYSELPFLLIHVLILKNAMVHGTGESRETLTPPILNLDVQGLVLISILSTGSLQASPLLSQEGQ